MESFLLESVGLKSGPAASVMKHMAEEYEIEDKEDLKHLTQRDMEDIISNCGLKRVPAGKLLVAWKASFGLKEAAEDDCATMSTEDKHEEISPDLPTGPFPDGKGGEGGPTETALAATKKPEHQSSEEGFLPGYSNTDGASPTEQNKQSLRLMYFDEAHNDEEGHRSLIVEREKTSELFQNMSGNAILFAVFGPARCGKSFLMNLLSGHRDLFEVAHGNLPCTNGVFISDIFNDGATFRRRADTVTVAPGGKAFSDDASVAYVDVEGLGDKGKAYDVHLIAPLLLVSKVLIYNWKGAPNKHVMLDSLFTLGEAAQKVGMTDSENGGVHKTTGKKALFGHLVVVLRDWHTTDEVYDLLFGLEMEPKRGDDAIRARNASRELVLSAFESITIKCLPYPGLSQSDSSMTRLSALFVTKYLELQSHLVDLSQAPNDRAEKLFNDRPLDGPTIATLLPVLADKLNSDEELLPKEVWRLMEEHRLHKILDEYRDEVKAWVAEREANGKLFPCPRANCAALGEQLAHFGKVEQCELITPANLGNWLSEETAADTREKYGIWIDEQVSLMIAQNDRVLEELTNTVAGKVAAFAAVLNSEITEELMPKLPFYYTSDFSVGETSGTSQIHETLGGHEALLADLSRRVERILSTAAADPECVALSEKSEQVLETGQAFLPQLEQALSAATKVIAALNSSLLARAESCRLRNGSELVAAVAAQRSASEAKAITLADYENALAKAKAEVETRVVEEINAICIESGLEVFRRSFPACEAAATSAAAAVPIAEALKAWLQHCRAHLEQAASAALTVLRAAIEEKQEQLPMKSGLLEAWTASQTNTAMQAIDPIALALGVSAPQRSEGGLETSEETPPHSASNLLQNCRSDLSVRCEVELRVIRTRNSELLRKESPPEAAHFGKLIASDGAVTCVVIVPQPSAKFSQPVEAVQVDRRPAPTIESEGDDDQGIPVQKGDVSVEWTAKDLSNGRAYTFRVRSRNVNGWSPWSKPTSAQPFGAPPAPKFLLPSPQQLSPCCISGDTSVTFQLDPKVGDGGSPITAYKVFFIPTDAAKAAKYMGEKMVDINDEVCFSGVQNSSSTPSPSASPTVSESVWKLTCNGLVNGVEYRFWLQAANQAGLGAKTSDKDSETVAVCTPAAPPPRPTIASIVPMDQALQIVLADIGLQMGNRNSPMGVQSPHATSGSDVILDSPAVPETSTYRVILREMQTYAYGPPQIKEYPADLIGNFTVRGLKNGTRYQVTVEAQNKIGWSHSSAPFIASPNTPYGRFKQVFSLCCKGPTASAGAVLEHEGPGSGADDDDENRRESRTEIDGQSGRITRKQGRGKVGARSEQETETVFLANSFNRLERGLFGAVFVAWALFWVVVPELIELGQASGTENDPTSAHWKVFSRVL